MTDPSLTSLPTLDEPGDAELISAVRAGDLEAYGALFERHVEAARRLARQLVSAGDVDDLVSDAFSKVLGVLQRGGGPDLAFRAYLLTSLRRLHVDKIRATSRLTTTDDMTAYDPGVPFEDTAVAGFDNATAAKAFAALPERWQQVLWHTEVEGQKPAEIAPLLGMSPNSVSALAYRAREGLRQAFVSMHAQEALDDACARTRANLGAYIRSGLSKRDSAKVDAHLQDCRECTAIYLELTEVNSNLGALLAPLLLGSAGAGYLAAAATGTKVGFLLFLGGAKNWILHNPVGRITAGATGVAAAAVVVAAVALSGGNHNPPPASAPEPSAPASAPPAANPPAANPPHKSTPKKSSPPVPPPAANPPAANPPAAPPAAPPSSSTPPAAPPQQAPVISTPLPAVDVTPGRSVVIDLTNGATDPNGDPLTVKSAKVAKPSHGTVRKGGKKARPVMPRLSGGKTGLSGSAPILARPAGGPTTVTYTPKPGWRGTDTIRYTLTDGHGGEVSGSVKVTTPNADPVAKSFTVPASGYWTPLFPKLLWPLSHTSDPNGDARQLVRVTQPQRGTVRELPDGSVSYSAQPGLEPYIDKFSYTVSDGHGGRATGTITVKVNGAEPPPVNSDPSAAPDTFDPLRDDNGPKTLDVLQNDTDRDKDPLHIASVTQPAAGTVAITDGGKALSYTPKRGEDGVFPFTYTVSDGRGGSDSASVQVDVWPTSTLGLSNKHPEGGSGEINTMFAASGIPDGRHATFNFTLEHGTLVTPLPVGCDDQQNAKQTEITCALDGSDNGSTIAHIDFNLDHEAHWKWSASVSADDFFAPKVSVGECRPKTGSSQGTAGSSKTTSSEDPPASKSPVATHPGRGESNEPSSQSKNSDSGSSADSGSGSSDGSTPNSSDDQPSLISKIVGALL